MVEDLLTSDYIFESDWEACNRVGGIYTVLPTRANMLQGKFRNRVLFMGPDVWQGKEDPLLIESDNLCAAWKEHALEKDELSVRVGRWNIPDEPVVILVDFQPFFERKGDIYTEMWSHYQVDSLHAHGNYDKTSMFSYTAGRVVESFYCYSLTEADKVVYQAHKRMTGTGALHVQEAMPEAITTLTTHVTPIGHSTVGDGKPSYDYLSAYNGDQMAQKLNMQSEHPIEKQTTYYVDCSTTASEVASNECKKLLDKPAGVVLMSGSEDGFVPKGSTFTGKCKHAHTLMLNVANELLGTNLGGDTLIVGTNGRYGLKDKGIDVFLESLNCLSKGKKLRKNVLAFINVPDWVGEPHEDLQTRLKSEDKFDTPLEVSLITYWLRNMTHDQVLDTSKCPRMGNRLEDKVKVTFVPCYLDGRDGIMNREYYDILLEQDLSVYASYYELWGYAPLESVTFHVPTVTMDLAGFGLQANGLKSQHGTNDGVEALHRSDYNYSEVADGIKGMITLFTDKTDKEAKEIRKHAAKVAEQALWKHFIQYYYEAYDIALRKTGVR